MPIEVQVGPPQIAIHQGQTVLISGEDGQIEWPTDKGLYFLDTRLISAWAVYADGNPWVLLNGGAIAYYASRIFLTNDAFVSRAGQVPARSLALIISREIDEGMHEDLDLTNYGGSPARFSLDVALRCDFADTFEVKSHKVVRRGQISTLWDPETQCCRTPTGTATSFGGLRSPPAEHRRSMPMDASPSRLIWNPEPPGIAA
jgi:hypothetical protein